MTPAIPNRADTLRLLRLIDRHEPILMLKGADDDYGTRWTIAGQQVQPALARHLMEAGYIVETGRTEFGARRLTLTAEGEQFRANGIRWWSSLSLYEKLKIVVFG
jgi:predicted alpha/beta-hydrolase family hydrolase